ncbi:MAG TPA: AbrB/MazE/SpoVT family DNA-binding domain-containing protein [Spirochaetales bacterium]|nr:AbrB/MazE/SpoVT family DNA-binding domain-containing protein [Spirochaetales bacterium]
MQTVIQKWGNSLGVRIPALYAREFDLKSGSAVEILEEAGRLVIVPKRDALEDLLALVTDENRHASVETGSPVGGEEW